MELKIYNENEALVTQALEWNHQELKTEITNSVEKYKNIVYTDSQIKDAKSDRSNLRKFVKQLDDKRKEVKKACLLPYKDFEAKINEVKALVEEPIALIDSQVKAYEEKAKDEKRDAIYDLFDDIGHPSWLDIEKVWEEKWLNASKSMAQIEKEINEKIEKIQSDIKVIERLENGDIAFRVYVQCLDLNKAIDKADKAVELVGNSNPTPKAEVKPIDDSNEVPEWITVRLNLTKTKAEMLADWLDKNGVEMEVV